MCGLTGFWDTEQQLADPPGTLAAMTGMLAHRGPDDQQIHCEADSGLGLGHRRLSILDLSPEGRQPMTSAGGRYVLAFNGEIYNYRDLGRDLAARGVTFRGHSDTEVFLAAVEAWGLDATLARLNGMFAMALWDRAERRLFLIRDRLGIKPLYYGRVGGVLAFASEPAALTRLPGFTGEIDRNALTLYLRHLYVPAPWSIYKDVRKLEPGRVLEFTADAARPGADLPTPRAFWSVREAVQNGLADPFTGDATAAVDQLEELLSDAVGQRLVSDVPLGAFLSGGVDSSTVVALMQRQSDRPVRTFAIGFADERFNEATYAGAVARHLGTDHTELIVSPQMGLDVVPELPGMYSEPFADSSQIPTFLVSRLARTDVTVSLSGDGGDELFCGYHRYNFAARLGGLAARYPAWLRQSGAAVARGVPAGAWDRVLGLLRPVSSDGRDFALTGDRLHKLAGMVAAPDYAGMYRNLVSLMPDPTRLVPGAREPETALTGPERQPPVTGDRNQAMYWDLISYLPDDILTKVDRASMAVGLEARVPLLDHRVVELAWRLPLQYKLREGQGKWVLRQVLDRHVPRELIERPKTGFSIPLATWLRGPLREWAEDLLGPDDLEAPGLLHAPRVRRTWDEFQSGQREWHAQLWTILMFQAWRRQWGRS